MTNLYEHTLPRSKEATLDYKGSLEGTDNRVRVLNGEIDTMASRIRDVPTKRVVYIDAKTGKAESAVEHFGSLWSSIKDKDVLLRVTRTMADKNEGQLERFGGHLASGGSTRAGYRYRVGEHGPEDFVAPANGQVVSNQDLRGGRGGVTVNVGQIVAQDYRDFTQQTQRRARAAAGGGVNF